MRALGLAAIGTGIVLAATGLTALAAPAAWQHGAGAPLITGATGLLLLAGLLTGPHHTR